MPKKIDLTSKKFGRLTVLEPALRPKNSKSKSQHWLCQCACGNFTIVAGEKLRSGHKQSCGCLRNPPIVIKNIPDYTYCGIYALVDENGKAYIGSSVNVKRRLIFHQRHFSIIKRGGSSGFVNKELHQAIRHGIVFEVVLVEKVADECLLWQRECYYIEKYGGLQNTYNQVFIPRKMGNAIPSAPSLPLKKQ